MEFAGGGPTCDDDADILVCSGLGNTDWPACLDAVLGPDHEGGRCVSCRQVRLVAPHDRTLPGGSSASDWPDMGPWGQVDGDSDQLT
jgi:hypothetical protein